MIAATNGYDLGVAFIGLMLALIGLYTARQARGARNSAKAADDEMRSPNGTRSGDLLYQVSKDMIDLRATTARLEAGQQVNDRRFRRIFSALDVKDPASEP